MIRFLRCNQFVIAIERYAWLVAINFNHNCLLFALHKTLAADMYHWLCIPVRLVQIKAVFFCLTVKCHKSLVVHTRFTALISGICRKIKHIPYMCCPDPRESCKTTHHIFMIFCLIFFCVISSVRMLTVQIWHTFCTVLRVAQRALWIAQMKQCKENII